MRRFALLLAAACAVALTGSAAVTAGPAAARIDSWSLPNHGGFAFGFHAAWIAGGDKLLRVDPRTGHVRKTFTLAHEVASPVVAGASIWLSDSTGVERFDPAAGKIAGHVAAPGSGMLAYGFGSIWDMTAAGVLLRIDPGTAAVVARIPVQGQTDWAPILAAGAGSVWVGSADEHAVIRVDPQTNQVAGSTPVADVDSLLTVGVGYGSVWAHQNAGAGGQGTLYRIDPATAAVTGTITASKGGSGKYGGTDIAFGAGGVWVGNGNRTVSRISSDGTTIVSSHTTPVDTEWLAVAAGYVWIQDDYGDAMRLPLARFAH